MEVPPRELKRRVYPPVGKCIYCGAEDRKLTIEHIIPFSLGGNLELPEASCRACQKITHAFEFTCARRIFGNFRMRHGLPTRRRKERPRAIPTVTADPNGNLRINSIPVEEHPAPLFIYTFKTAGILIGAPPHLRTWDWKLVVIQSNAEMQDFHQKYGAMHVTVKMVPVELARMLAKIGHAYAVAEHGLNSFRPLALDVILGRDDNLGYLVGGSHDPAPAIHNAGHVISTEYRGYASGPGLLIANVRLFASVQSPSYHVVVGQVESAEQIRTMARKSLDKGIVESSVAASQRIPRP
jgi:HNH endonuclease